MILSRRKLLIGGGLIVVTAPAIVRAASLMPINPRLVPSGWTLPGLKYWKLEGRTPVPCEMMECFEAPRHVGDDYICEHGPASRVSTVFLGIDHGFGWLEPDKPYRPVLFETMVFGGALDGDGGRYCTYAEAEAGHAAMVKRLRGET